ncbi:hypothetical protein BKA70DRAFT_1527097 [Coprinopsis sp. MPI-PUGE-AT-0042]|nr:hypothetical protein BKA70DRAFT_1527097 [Coprinopsis sp. MPI-PUGE-AT-0042]
MFTKGFVALLAIVSLGINADAFPQYDTAGEMPGSKGLQGPKDVFPPSPPTPPIFQGTKLVNDKSHPYKAPKKDDLRGPCPGLNTLANHGWLPRNGVATPFQIIDAVQEAFNMESDIGDKTSKTGLDPPAPAIVGGLNNHGTFEGDASMTRADAYFGDNHSFNPALFDEFKNFSMIYGNGYFNGTVAGELRYHRIQRSIATNPTFEMLGFRHTTAYAEASFPATFFVDGRITGHMAGQLDMATAERFFKDMQFPKDFHRPAAPVSGSALRAIYAAHPTEPGRNVNGTNTFQPDHSVGSVTDTCGFYTGFVMTKVTSLYPNPYWTIEEELEEEFTSGCEQVFPYGRD